MSWWVRVGCVKENGMVTVNYGIRGAESFNREVDEDMSRMLQRAIDSGREEMRKEIRNLLGIL